MGDASDALTTLNRSGARIQPYGNPGRPPRVLTDGHAKVRRGAGHSFEPDATRPRNGPDPLAAQDGSRSRTEGYHDTRPAGVVSHGQAPFS